MNKSRQQRNLIVKRISDLTPNMRRITFGGDDLLDAPSMLGGYVKLLFESTDNPAIRTYTIAGQRMDQNEIDIDFMLHGDHGFACSWASHANTGDVIAMKGNGPRKSMDDSADWFLIVGDMTSLPALSLNISDLPEDAKGVAYIEVLSDLDIQLVDKPKGVIINWTVNPVPGSDDVPLTKAVIDGEWFEGEPSIWVACEFKSMKVIRAYLKSKSNVNRERFYTSSYWKKGLIEDQHKVFKSQDAVQFESAPR